MSPAILGSSSPSIRSSPGGTYVGSGVIRTRSHSSNGAKSLNGGSATRGGFGGWGNRPACFIRKSPPQRPAISSRYRPRSGAPDAPGTARTTGTGLQPSLSQRDLQSLGHERPTPLPTHGSRGASGLLCRSLASPVGLIHIHPIAALAVARRDAAIGQPHVA